MAANLLGTVTNVVLDPLFILALDGGIAGAAIATALGNGVSAAYLVWYCIEKCPCYSFRLRDILLEREVALPVVALGLCMGMQPANSYNYARGDSRRTGEIVRKTALTTLAVGTALTVPCFVLRESLILAFVDNAEILSIGKVMLTATLLISPFYGIYQLCTSYLKATGKAGYATLTSLLNKGIIYISVLLILHRCFGMYGIVYTALVTDALSIAAALVLCRLAMRGTDMRPAAREPQADTAGAAEKSGSETL